MAHLRPCATIPSMSSSIPEDVRWRSPWVFRRRDRSGWWVGWYDRTGRRHGQRYPTRKVAEAARREIENALNPWAAPAPPMPWQTACERFGISRAGATPKHRADLAAVLARFGASTGIDNLGGYTQSTIERYFAQRAGKAAGTRRREYNALHAFGRWAVDSGLLARNPLDGIPKPRLPQRIRRPPDTLAWCRLLEATHRADLDDPQAWYVLVLLAVVTGLRQSALTAVRIEDIELGTTETDGIGLLTSYTPKTARSRLHGMPPVVCDRVAVRIAHLPAGTVDLFPWRHLVRFPRRGWDRLVKTAGISCTFHDLRRAAGTQAALARLQAAGASHLDHSDTEVFRSHYEDQAALAVAIARRLVLPDLPPMPMPRPH